MTPRWLTPLTLTLLLTACPDGGGGDDELGSGSEAGDSDVSSGDVGSSSSDTSIGTDSSSSSETVATLDSDSSESSVECSYPAGAVEPMALGGVLTPYSWPEAIHADGTKLALDLVHAPCASDPLIDWSVHELLVFISIPAW